MRPDRFVSLAKSSASLVDGEGSYDQEIVGEASYLPALRAIAGKGEVRHECDAILCRDDENKFDDQAIVVLIDGNTVGYLSRANARAFRKRYQNSVQCPAVIVGGGEGREHLGVWLDMPLLS